MRTYPRYKHFFHWTQRIAQNVEEKKVKVFSIAIWVVISAVQLLTKKITTGTQTNIYGVDISFLQKIPIVNVRLGSKYTSQLPLIQDTNFFSLKPTHCTGRWRKENWGIFDSYLNCDFYHPVANKKNYNRNPVKHLRWRFSFLQKIPIANVRLGFKCTF